MRAIKREDCVITVEAEPEDADPAGCFSTGDAGIDRELVDEINSKRAAGNTWIWASVRVTVTCDPFSADGYLGWCSYESETDFRETSGYFDDMVNACLRQINADLRVFAAKLGETVSHES